MKNNRYALILLLTLALARAACAADAVSLITGGTVTEDTAVWTAFSRSALDTVVSPYQPKPDAEACTSRAETIGRQLDDWNRLKDRLAAARFGVSEEAVVRRKETLTGLKNVYPSIISALTRKAHIEAMLAERRADISAPELTLTEKPPYTLNYYNAYIDHLDELSEQIDDAQYDLDHTAAAAQHAHDLVSEREAAWRLARDILAKGETPQTRWQMIDAAFQLEAARARCVLADLKRGNAATVLEIRKLARDRYTRVRAYIRSNLDLEEKSFERQTAELDAAVKALEDTRAQLNLNYIHALNELEAAQMRYASARGEERAAALIERDLREDERDAARKKLEYLQGQLNILTARKRAWTLRYDIARGTADLSAIPAAVHNLRDGVRSLDEQLAEVQKDMQVSQGRLSAVQKQIDAGSAAPAVLDMLVKNRASLQAAIDNSLAYSALVFSTRAQGRALIAELQDRYQTVPLREKLRAWWQTQGERLLSTELWQSGGYAVRLREFLLALALIVLGNWGTRRAFAMLLWVLSLRFSIDETSRKSLTRLFSYLAGLIIFLAALHIVGIPLTAFAFLGGAIAIGIGFGTQNLFKNLVSGILLTLKRPFRLGNVIEVGDVLGSVSDIGVSATIIRTFDGRDVIIPNSDLLEKQLVNWSLSDHLLRSKIEVGVEYGTSPRRLREVLLAVLDANTDVLKFPAPSVRLTGYGESELEFVVTFWVDQRQASAYGVACQLREDFLYALEDAGIEMAYPHMDVNLLKPQTPSEPDVHSDPAMPV